MTFGRPSRRWAVFLSTVFLVAAPAVARAETCKPTWSTVPKPPMQMQDVDAVSATDAWALGDASNEQKIAHWDGTAWSLVPLNVATTRYPQFDLRSISTVSADDVWAVGTSIGLWNGVSWSFATNPLAKLLWLVGAAAADDAWAAPTDASAFLHWDGAGWSTVPAPPLAANPRLRSLAVVGPSDAWAVGDADNQTLVVHWDGTAWSRVPSPNGPGFSSSLSGVVAVSPNDGWAVGNSMSQPLIEHWDGTGWSIVPSPAPPHPGVLNDVSAVSANDVWAVGTTDVYDAAGQLLGPGALTEHWDGQRWSLVDSGSSVPRQMWSVSALPDGTIFAAAGAAYMLCEIRLSESAVTPSAARGNSLGYGVAWGVEPDAQPGHTVTDASKLGLFDSGPLPPGGSFTYNFPGAGVYRVSDALTGVVSTVSIGLTATPGSGTTTTTYIVGWATASAPPGYAYDVQVLRPNQTAYVNYLTGTAEPNAGFTPDAGSGTYSFRARLRNTSNGASSGWSGGKSLSVS